MNKSLLLQAIRQSNLHPTTKSFLGEILKSPIGTTQAGVTPMEHSEEYGWGDEEAFDEAGMLGENEASVAEAGLMPPAVDATLLPPVGRPRGNYSPFAAGDDTQ